MIMTKFETVTLIVSIIALIVSFIAIYQTHCQNKNNQGQIELMIEESISRSKDRISDLKLMDRKDDTYKQTLKVAIEEYINAYEKACSLYLDSKVDKERFKKQYHKCVKDIVEEKNFSEKFDKVSSPYKALLKVYEEWNNYEK